MFIYLMKYENEYGTNFDMTHVENPKMLIMSDSVYSESEIDYENFELVKFETKQQAIAVKRYLHDTYSEYNILTSTGKKTRVFDVAIYETMLELLRKGIEVFNILDIFLYQVVNPKLNEISLPNKVPDTPLIPSLNSGEEEKLSIELNGKRFSGKTVPEFFRQILVYLVDNDIITNSMLPIPNGNGKIRNIISLEPVNRKNEPISSQHIEYKGHYMETHTSREGSYNILKNLVKFLNDQETRNSL